MKTLIIEDKEMIREALKRLLELADPEIVVVAECASVQEALVVVKACKPELVFLDIHLLDGTGFDFLEASEYRDFKVIFTTGHEEFALKALKAGAVDYLLKPVDFDELVNALDKVKNASIQEQRKDINRAKKQFEEGEETLILSLQDAYQVIQLKELMYCQSDKGYTTFYLTDGKRHMASKPLIEFEEQLANANFSRPHQSYMVNLKYIDKFDKSGMIFLKNGVKIPVSTRKKENFLSRFFSVKKD